MGFALLLTGIGFLVLVLRLPFEAAGLRRGPPQGGDAEAHQRRRPCLSQ